LLASISGAADDLIAYTTSPASATASASAAAGAKGPSLGTKAGVEVEVDVELVDSYCKVLRSTVCLSHTVAIAERALVARLDKCGGRTDDDLFGPQPTVAATDDSGSGIDNGKDLHAMKGLVGRLMRCIYHNNQPDGKKDKDRNKRMLSDCDESGAALLTEAGHDMYRSLQAELLDSLAKWNIESVMRASEGEEGLVMKLLVIGDK
jgi:hypothetical protein